MNYRIIKKNEIQLTFFRKRTHFDILNQLLTFLHSAIYPLRKLNRDPQNIGKKVEDSSEN